MRPIGARGVYSAELIRTSIVSVPPSMPKLPNSSRCRIASLRRIILPQALPLPSPLGHETITVLKGISGQSDCERFNDFRIGPRIVVRIRKEALEGY